LLSPTLKEQAWIGQSGRLPFMPGEKGYLSGLPASRHDPDTRPLPYAHQGLRLSQGFFPMGAYTLAPGSAKTLADASRLLTAHIQP